MTNFIEETTGNAEEEILTTCKRCGSPFFRETKEKDGKITVSCLECNLIIEGLNGIPWAKDGRSQNELS